MTILRGFLITLGSGLAFGLGAAAAGYSLAAGFPIPFCFGFPTRRAFDPIEIGVGVGLTNGGPVLVAAVTWYNGRVHGCQH
jgi:hypothetical protein